jgi:hypothetical protein
MSCLWQGLSPALWGNASVPWLVCAGSVARSEMENRAGVSALCLAPPGFWSHLSGCLGIGLRPTGLIPLLPATCLIANKLSRLNIVNEPRTSCPRWIIDFRVPATKIITETLKQTHSWVSRDPVGTDSTFAQVPTDDIMHHSRLLSTLGCFLLSSSPRLRSDW